ncbi:TetR/AcrR family transcriptional regulator [Sphaerisporangium perillae]|uniref:TetR/AcrR family transcriptional regulator n=1 Tax=Sphaerisporangium perillae TaxID=2935860 RepID=UPI00200BA9A2|nr:TetR/AcrR family transcriptional regulator [Sphaerisporangium perillae]
MISTPAAHSDEELDWRESPALALSPILTAALDAFYEQGYHGTSVRDIAGRVGVTVPALYYHHQNKEAILFSLLDSSIDRLWRMCRAAQAESGDPAVRFANLIECVVRFMAKSDKIASLDAEIRSLSPELRQRYTARRDEIEVMLLDAVRGGVAAGVFDVALPKDTVRALFGMVQAIPTWYRADGRLTVDEIAHRYLDIAGHTVGAVPELLERWRSMGEKPA